MSAVILVIHLILALTIIGLVMLQRSEGGGLGVGSTGGLGAFASPQSTASVISRVTWICAGCFFTTSLILGIMSGQASNAKRSVLDQIPSAITETAKTEAPAVPVDDAAAKPADETKSKTTSSKKSEPVKPKEPSVPVSE